MQVQVLGVVQFAEEKRNRGGGEGQLAGVDHWFGAVNEQVRLHGVRKSGARLTRSSRECERACGLERERRGEDARGSGRDRGRQRMEREVWRETG